MTCHIGNVWRGEVEEKWRRSGGEAGEKRGRSGGEAGEKRGMNACNCRIHNGEKPYCLEVIPYGLQVVIYNLIHRSTIFVKSRTLKNNLPFLFLFLTLFFRIYTTRKSHSHGE